MRVKKYFAWLHLPPHLQEISCPFGLVAEKVEAKKDVNTDYKSLLAAVDNTPSFDSEMTKYCKAKIRLASAESLPTKKLLLLWEAKNAATVAALAS